ncbi:MAG: menaquinone biosynthesis decarboxylase [Opitutales bacterium]|nr:menaquinone biosynthesis decarboxylase [Opitutales bacterium]
MKTHYKNIGEFIAELEKFGELMRVSEPVSPEIEISKITDAESKKPGGGKALLFENVVDGGKKSFPIATNLFGSEKRMSMALGVPSFADAEKAVAELVETDPPQSLADLAAFAKKILPLARITPKLSRGTPPCQEVVKTGADIDLSEIPVLKCWPHDGGRFVTLPLVFTKSLDGKKRNLGMYRLQIFDEKTTGMHWHVHKDGSHYFGEYKRARRRMPVAVAIGADPATVYAATAPMPRGVDELLLAGFFRRRGVRMAKCLTIDMEVPADAEFVLEGYVEPDELRTEGPFGDHTGYYSAADLYPVFHLTAITRKKSPIYCATLVGPPPMEDCYMAKATERIFLPLLRAVMPEIKDYFLPWEGVFHNIAVVSIRKEFPAHAQKLAQGLWGQGQMSFCKAVVAVDDDVDPSDLGAVWAKFLDSFDPKSDAFIGEGVLDVLDHSAPRPLRGSKIGIDLTKRLPSEEPRKIFPLEPHSMADIKECEDFIKSNIPQAKEIKMTDAFFAVSVEKGGARGRDILGKIAACPKLSGFARAAAIFDGDVGLGSPSKLLWKIFNNTDPARDIVFAENGLTLIDACRKNRADGYEREWPEDLSFDK